jgi:hypothetical protein
MTTSPATVTTAEADPPVIVRPRVPTVADERVMLETWLEFHRATLLMKCAGLSDDQLRLRPVQPSRLSLLGLIRHLSEVETGWLIRGVVNDHVPAIYCTEHDPDADFTGVDRADVEDAFAIYTDVVQRARAAMAEHDLDYEVGSADGNVTFSVRWIYLHMIEEYARHNGHADLIRERIDGVTGE